MEGTGAGGHKERVLVGGRQDRALSPTRAEGEDATKGGMIQNFPGSWV